MQGNLLEINTELLPQSQWELSFSACRQVPGTVTFWHPSITPALCVQMSEAAPQWQTWRDLLLLTAAGTCSLLKRWKTCGLETKNQAEQNALKSKRKFLPTSAGPGIHPSSWWLMGMCHPASWVCGFSTARTPRVSSAALQHEHSNTGCTVRVPITKRSHSYINPNIFLYRNICWPVPSNEWEKLLVS